LSKRKRPDRATWREAERTARAIDMITEDEQRDLRSRAEEDLRAAHAARRCARPGCGHARVSHAEVWGAEDFGACFCTCPGFLRVFGPAERLAMLIEAGDRLDESPEALDAFRAVLAIVKGP